MYLKALTLRGFKSFASSTTLAFEPGITCVVGPNGSGKSNIVDALSWVMGEQGVKSLRGGKMEDVIFAGTSGRPPLGRAEVLLTIDNSDGALPIDYTEVTISRTMFRSGGSDYAINGTNCRLLDVQELLSDSGMGREMHVIVGQGQLDSILNATPETRRGLIEEAAGVLKHRRRKEKAERKLEATAANLNRLSDLLGEIRRQLKPLGRQAEVARRAAVIQADVFDARARLMADDYAAAASSLASDQAAETRLRLQRQQVEEALDAARAAEQAAEQAAASAMPELTRAQETWYALAGLKERIAATASIAAERQRNATQAVDDERPGRDPDAIEREAASVREAEDGLRAEAASKAQALTDASEALREAERAHTDAEQHYTAQLRAIADRREGLARLTGEVNTLRSRSEFADGELARLTGEREQARERAQQAQESFAPLQARLDAWGESEAGLDAAYEAARADVDHLAGDLDELRHADHQAAADQGAAAARIEALQLGLDRKDASAALLAAGDALGGVLGSVADLVSVPKGDEAAVAAALGVAVDAVAIAGLDDAVAALGHLKDEDLGRAGMLLGGSASLADPSAWPALPAGVSYAATLVGCADELRPALERLLFKVAVVDDVAQARALVAQVPDVTAAARTGDVVSAWLAVGGSSAKPSLIEVRAAIDDAQARLVEADAEGERVRVAIAECGERLAVARERAEDALARLNESDAEHAALAQQASDLRQATRAAMAEADKLDASIASLEQTRATTREALAGLQDRLELASEQSGATTADPSERDRLADVESAARSAELEARLALRTLEERARALAGRADSLARTAQAERDALAKAQARRVQLKREAEAAQVVSTAATWLIGRVGESLALADQARSDAQGRRSAAERDLSDARQRGRELAKQFESLVDTVHRDELARTQQQMRIDALAEKAMTELGYEPEALVAEFGPDVPIPVVGEDEEPASKPFVRAEQEKRLRAAERDLAVLGKVNPLALEEFDAMQERHTFLSEQLDDLRKTRTDLMGIISEVDTHMQEVFARAYEDVSREFKLAFERLFPGGDGRLVLTEPGQWLTTGVDVEARPAGKKVKRLSLLSGGERSLVAVAFLVALFKARPSPFYILDEVEAALDDVNLGRLLEIYEELRTTSQLLVITHQKRTMEVADSLYGITMRSDGVSAVISQRLADE